MIVPLRSHPQSSVLTSPSHGDWMSWRVTTPQRWAIKALLILSAACYGSPVLTSQREKPFCPKPWLRFLAQHRSSGSGGLNCFTSRLTDRWWVKFSCAKSIGNEALKVFLRFEWLALRNLRISPVIMS